MKSRCQKWWLGAVASAVLIVGFGGLASAGDETAAQAGEKIGVEGQFVRVAANDEGWVVVGYRVANGSVGHEWMLLDVGMTLQQGVKGQKITRDSVFLVNPDNKIIPLASQQEFEKADLRALDARASMESDSINYFPGSAKRPCRVGFFADSTTPGRALAYDQVELNNLAACVGRLYFQVPGGIQYGNYNLDVKFADSTIRVPMKIMTKDEAKAFENQWKQELKEAKHKGHDH